VRYAKVHCLRTEMMRPNREGGGLSRISDGQAPFVGQKHAAPLRVQQRRKITRVVQGGRPRSQPRIVRQRKRSHGLRHARTECPLWSDLAVQSGTDPGSAAGTGEECGDDVGGVPVERHSCAVIGGWGVGGVSAWDSCSATGTGGVGGSCGLRLDRSGSSSSAWRPRCRLASSSAGAAVIVTSPALSG
jgi:hypothetical protein